MSTPSSANSVTVRLELPAAPRAVSELTAAVEAGGGIVTALDVTSSGADRVQVDVTCSVPDPTSTDPLLDALRAIPGVRLGPVSDRTFLVHLGGKLTVEPKLPIRNRDDLSLVYTPGVARVCQAIAANPEDARRLTIKRNTVAVVTDGSAVLGLGNIGPLAAMPVMEGKAALFKRFAGIDAFPICLSTQDTDEIVAAVVAIAPGFAGINLEDISAPRCFEVEARLRAALDVPVFHDDQHGTAIVVVAALTNALKVVGKELGEVRITMAGAGAAGTAVLKLLLAAGAGAGAGEVVVCDEHGALHAGRTDLHDSLAWTVEHTNARGFAGSVKEAVVGADVFIGVSAPNILDGADVAAMAERSIVFALANPTPEVDPAVAAQHAAVVATGRSDVANQINNVLVFPGVFRGLLDARSKDVSEATMLAAALALAGVVDDAELNAAYIVPSVFHPDVAAVVAQAVAAAVHGADPGEAAEAAVDSAGAGAGEGMPALEAPSVL